MNFFQTAVQILSALLTPVNAVLLGFIAYQQWRLAKEKFRFDLYDKRFETYRTVAEFISHIRGHGNCTDDESIAFYQKASRNLFLFSSEIDEYITVLYKQAIKKNGLNREILNTRSEAQQPHRVRLGKQEEDIGLWFQEQFEASKKLFGKYLQLHRS
jgi:hypothetical protein